MPRTAPGMVCSSFFDQSGVRVYSIYTVGLEQDRRFQ